MDKNSRCQNGLIGAHEIPLSPHRHVTGTHEDYTHGDFMGAYGDYMEIHYP